MIHVRGVVSPTMVHKLILEASIIQQVLIGGISSMHIEDSTTDTGMVYNNTHTQELAS